ncbi:extensin family protein [Polyangium aurulentum]|uniref:extensin family protein n=1 Tax=Polyangium aurulentum TaxID=2567896 RepID=UPI0010AE81D1|nr:extensin family protein [Polyangium aurulentum]UQA60939.1 extensin family protein [Polyangium aurulentum]
MVSVHGLRILRSSLFGALALGLGLLHGGTAKAASPFLVVPEPAEAESTPAYRYANMTDDEAFAELDRRQIPYTRVAVAPGVRAPIRLAGRLHGVYIHSSVPLEQRATTMFEILDARLALALDDFAAVLERHDIDEVVHYTMYRPNVAREDHGARDVAQKPRTASARPGPRAAVSTAGQARTRASKVAPKVAEKTPAKAIAPAAPEKAPAKAVAPPVAEKTPAKAAAPAPAKVPAVKLPAAVAPDKSALEMKKPGEGAAPSGKKQKSPAPPAPKPREVVAAEAPAAKGSAPPVVAKPAPAAVKGSAPVVAKPAPAAVKGTAPVEAKPAPAAPKVVVKPAPAEKVAKAPVVPVPRPHPRTTWAPPGTRHPAGLAIDVGLLHKRDGTWLSVESHFHGQIGAQTCGDGAPTPQDPRARELRELVCESQTGGIFTYVLTPNYNAAHVDHYHMEIKPGVHWFLFH